LLDLQRRKAKAAFVVAGLLVGVSTVVGLVSLTGALTDDINHKLEQYGANILVVPKTENLSLSYGGLSLGGVSFEMEELRQVGLERIAGIRNAGNVAKAPGAPEGGEGPVLTLAVPSMTCGSCEGRITRVLEKQNWVRAVAVDLRAKVVRVFYEAQSADPKALADAVTAAGYPARYLPPDAPLPAPGKFGGGCGGGCCDNRG